MTEEKITKRIPNKKISSRMKKIINGEFIEKVNNDAKNKIKVWKEEILEKNIKNIENSIEAKVENNIVNFENLELTPKIKKRKKILQNAEIKKNFEEKKEEKNFLNIDENFDKEENKTEEAKPKDNFKEEENETEEARPKDNFKEEENEIEKISILEFEKNFEEKKEKEKNIQEKIFGKIENPENITKKIFEEYDIEIIKTQNNEKKFSFLKLFFYMIFIGFFIFSSIFLYKNKENIFNFFEEKINPKENQEEKIENKVEEKIENKTITVGKTDFNIQIITKENKKIYKFEGVGYKNFTELKKHLNHLIEEQEKIDAEDKIKQKIRSEFSR